VGEQLLAAWQRSARGAAARPPGAPAHACLPPLRLTHPQVDSNKALPANNAIRGAYINSQSRDIGPDRQI
jgi:hypothetical protein